MNSRKVPAGDLASAIVDSLREYTEAVQEGIRKQVDLTATVIKNDIVVKSPKRTGAYKRGWSVYKRDTQNVTQRIVHNKSRYMLAHLLEHGHAKRGGGRVEGIPHIRPVAEVRLQEFEDNVKRIIEKGG